jgi:hypothetical protein
MNRIDSAFDENTVVTGQWNHVRDGSKGYKITGVFQIGFIAGYPESPIPEMFSQTDNQKKRHADTG